MNWFRRLLLLVLCLTLPVYGLAAIGIAPGCPMQAAGAAATQIPGMAAVDHHCDQMAAADVAADPGAPSHGQPNHDCRGCCHVYQPPVLELSVAPMLRVSRVVLAEPSLPVFSRDPEGLWRPPRAL